MSVSKLVPLLLVAIVAAGGGWLVATQMGERPGAGVAGGAAGKGDGPCPGGAAAAYWKAPMDPTYVRDAPGTSPMGMELVPVCPGETDGNDGRIRVASALIQSSGVRTARVERRDLARKIRTVGRVDYDERRVSHVHTKIQGWIEKLYVDYAGQTVERGEPLLEIYSPELVSTQEELLVALQYRKATEESSFADIAEGGDALFRASRRRLELWDIPEADIERLLSTGEVRKTLTLYAPNSGVVTHLMVREGMAVAPNTNLYTIADLSRVWVYADIYEYELPWIEVGQRGVVELSYLPQKSFEGVVTYVYPFLEAKTRTARARIELQNPGTFLKPEMYANVTIETDVRSQVLTIPEEAVIRSGRRTLVIIALPGGYFEPRDVGIGIDSGDGWLEIATGLSEGELIVTSGQFLLDSESKLQEAVQKFLKAGSDDSANEAEPMKMPAPAAGTDPPHAGHSIPAAQE